MLLFQFQTRSTDDLQPRQPDWLLVLDQCKQVDPENALYDYLAAVHHWMASATYGWADDDQDDGYVLTVEVEQQFDEGNRRFAAGLALPRLCFGTTGHAATFKFLDQTSVPRSEYLQAGASRQIDGRASRLLYGIIRWQCVQRDTEKRAGRLDAAIVASRNMLIVSEQVKQAGNVPNLIGPRLQLRRSCVASLKAIHDEHPNIVSADDAANLPAELTAAQLEMEIVNEIGRRMAAKAGTVVSGGVAANGTVWSVILMLGSQMLVIVCVVLAFISSLFGFGDSSDENGEDVRAAFGWTKPTVAWLAGTIISFAVLAAFAVLKTPTKSIGPTSPSTASRWTSAFTQWLNYCGPLLVPLVAATIVIAWYLLHRARHVDGGLWKIVRSKKISHLRQSARLIASSSLRAALVFVAVYLVAMPAVADKMDTYHRVYYSRLVRPDRAWQEIAEVKAEIEEDEQTMAEIQQSVDEQNRQLEKQR